MDTHEKYFFDVNGYLVVEAILTPEQVAALNEAIDHNPDKGCTDGRALRCTASQKCAIHRGAVVVQLGHVGSLTDLG